MLIDVARVLRRMWVWVLVVLVGAAGVGVGAFFAVPPMRVSTAQVLFVPSVKQPGVAGPTNPFLSLDGSVVIVASLVQISVSDDQTAQALAERGQTAEYTVEPNLRDNAGPVLIVTVKDHSVSMAQSTMRAMIREIQQTLERLQRQQRVEPDLLVGSVVLTSSVEPKVDWKVPLQVGAIALAGTLVISLSLILLTDRVRRRSRKAGLEEAVEIGDTEGDEPEPLAVDEWERALQERGAREDDDDYTTTARRR